MTQYKRAIHRQTIAPLHAAVARTLGRKLRYLRSQVGVTQQTVGDSVGTDRSYISRLERGTVMPRLSTLVRLANYFGVDVATLLSSGSTSKHEKSQ